jgi:hypothetical protein
MLVFWEERYPRWWVRLHVIEIEKTPIVVIQSPGRCTIGVLHHIVHYLNYMSNRMVLVSANAELDSAAVL